MELIKFRVRMYKGIIDSGWVDVNNLTVLVGKNESGKTSVLKALHKLNPYNSGAQDTAPEKYNIESEWPRLRLDERNEQYIVCRAKFQFSDEEKSELTKIAERETLPDIVEVSRNYAGEMKIDFEEKIFPYEPPDRTNDINSHTLPEVREQFSAKFKQLANECLDQTKRLIADGQLDELSELIELHEILLPEVMSPREHLYQIENQFIRQYFSALKSLIDKDKQPPSPQSRVNKYIINHLPTFIYISDYSIFNGSARLEEVRNRQDTNDLTEEDRTFLALLELSGLDLNTLLQLGEGNIAPRKQRQYYLAGGSESLTRIISDRLRQRRYEIDYRVDGPHFFTYIKDNHDPSLIELEERSRGFQWFFSFDLMLTRETKGAFEGCVILLDEPGLHLHPNAQEDLLHRFEEYANNNTLLYTTHLPFMIDLNYPDRIRVLKESKEGIVVTTDLVDSSPESRFVLEAALGMDASQSFLVAEQNLVVEGVDDYWVLTGLSNLLRQNGDKGLPEDVFITPGGSASTAVHIATIMIGQNLDVVALFDSDEEGRRAQEKLDHNWITQYNQARTKTILLGDAVGASGDFALEDLFPDNFITDIVMEVYENKLAAAGINDITLQGEDILWRKIVRFMKTNGIEGINKGPVAKQLRNKLSDMNDISELSNGTLQKAIKLFQTIRKAFGEEEDTPF